MNPEIINESTNNVNPQNVDTNVAPQTQIRETQSLSFTHAQNVTIDRSNRKLLIIGAVIAAVSVIGTMVWYLLKNSNYVTKTPYPELGTFTTLDITNNNQTQTNIDTTISLLGDNYKKSFTFPPSSGVDYTSESYEWVKGVETVDNWKTLVTTHKLTPVSADKPISAEVYAQNVAQLNTDRGAVILETSVINTEDAKKEGVDITNPPYVLIYAYPRSNETDPIELNFQKIEKLIGGKVGVFIYAERLNNLSKDAVNAYSSSPEFYKKRMAVILQKFPY